MAGKIHRVVQDPQYFDHFSTVTLDDSEQQKVPSSTAIAGDVQGEKTRLDVITRFGAKRSWSRFEGLQRAGDRTCICFSLSLSEILSRPNADFFQIVIGRRRRPHLPRDSFSNHFARRVRDFRRDGLIIEFTYFSMSLSVSRTR